MTFKKEGNHLSAKLNYDTVTDNGRKISIDNIFSLSETGAYFDWGLEHCGFGQFSFSYKKENGKDKWQISNECMGPESSGAILKAFEEAIRASGDEKAIYCLNRIISLIAYQSNSLAKSILLIWNSAEKEGGEVETFDESLTEYCKSVKRDLKNEKNMLICSDLFSLEDVKLYTICTNHVSYTNKNGSFYEANLDLFFDIAYMKHGFVTVTHKIDLNSGETKWVVSNGIEEKVLATIFKTLEHSDGEYHKIWNIWKSAVKINSSPAKMATTILEASKSRTTRYPVK